MCIDESVLSTLCGSNVIPVTPPMTTMKEGGESRVESGPGSSAFETGGGAGVIP